MPSPKQLFVVWWSEATNHTDRSTDRLTDPTPTDRPTTRTDGPTDRQTDEPLERPSFLEGPILMHSRACLEAHVPSSKTFMACTWRFGHICLAPKFQDLALWQECQSSVQDKTGQHLVLPGTGRAQPSYESPSSCRHVFPRVVGLSYN